MFANGTGRVFLQPRRHALRVEDVLALQLHEVLILLELAVADYAHVLVLLLLRSLELLDWELSDLLLRQPLFLLMKVASRKHADQATQIVNHNHSLSTAIRISLPFTLHASFGTVSESISTMMIPAHRARIWTV